MPSEIELPDTVVCEIPPPKTAELEHPPALSIANPVRSSPQRYSLAFNSQVPRLKPAAYYSAPDSRQLVTEAGSPRQLHYKIEDHLKIEVKDPRRQHSVFCSTVERFASDGNNTRAHGMHPGLLQAQPSFAVDKSAHIESDRSHWTRQSFFQSRTPRLCESPRSLSADHEPLNYAAAGEHVNGMRLSLSSCVRVSPQKLRVMSSRSKRFKMQRSAYDTCLGPGSYNATSTFNVPDPSKPHCVFASQSPRLHIQQPATSVGSSMSSVKDDRARWLQPRVWMSKASSGRACTGPQLGSFEGLSGLNRVLSPDRRSPDITYLIEQSVQKRPLAQEIAASNLRYSPAFRSTSPRLSSAPATILTEQHVHKFSHRRA